MNVTKNRAAAKPFIVEEPPVCPDMVFAEFYRFPSQGEEHIGWIEIIWTKLLTEIAEAAGVGEPANDLRAGGVAPGQITRCAVLLEKAASGNAFSALPAILYHLLNGSRDDRFGQQLIVGARLVRKRGSAQGYWLVSWLQVLWPTVPDSWSRMEFRRSSGEP